MMKYKDEYIEWFDYNIRVSNGWLKAIEIEDATAIAWTAAEMIAESHTNKAYMKSMGVPALDLLETRFEAGCYIGKGDRGWCLFEKNGEMVTGGKTIRQLLVNLILTDC